MELIKELLFNTDKKLAEFYLWAKNFWLSFGLHPVFLDIIIQLLVVIAVAAFLVFNALFIIYYDRKVAAKFQVRYGPNRVGYKGILQTVADTIKLLIKEDINPDKVDKVIFVLAPFLVFIPAFMVFLVIPFGKGLIPADLNIGILYVLAITGLSVIGILSAGWASNNKYSLIGGLRSAAQIVSYEIPMVLAILAILILAGSLKMGDIVNAQSSISKWFIFLQPVGFLIFLIAGNAEINRAPFDLPEAESELVSGFITEYSALKFAFFFLAEYTNLFLTSAIATTLFLGGWQGPFLPSFVWFIIKVYLVVTFLMWIRWTFPRIRVDQLMEFSWKYLIPIAFLNLIITAIVVKIV
jgi:NADH-quinone oxidoreductase subunit H